jgi:hypothetical protein
MKKNIIYDSKKYSATDGVTLSSKGAIFLCPICQSNLLIITSKETAIQYKKPQGIFCPISDNHVWIKFILIEERQQFWEKVEKNLKEIEEKNTD